jgi:DNA-directed RNA polymerase sigma subunit (sigma70/sigma32)
VSTVPRDFPTRSRNRQMWFRRNEGATLQAIADEFGVTPERVRQIVWAESRLMRAYRNVPIRLTNLTPQRRVKVRRIA